MLLVKNLSVVLGQTTILSDISLSVQNGETVGIIGPNGSGKTTFFNTLSGFIKHSSGEIFFDGVEISSLAPHLRAQKGIGRVFQNFGIFRNLTVLENLVLSFESKLSLFQSVFPSPSRIKLYQEQAMDLLAKVKLTDKANAAAGSLSGGQMRLLEIARTLALNSTLLLLDEPTAGVSPKLKDQVMESIQEVIKSGKTVLIIEHDMNFIKGFVQRIVVLEQGRVFMDDLPQKVMASPELREIYFGSDGVTTQ